MAQHVIPRRNQGGGLATRGQQYPLDVFRREMDSLVDRFFGGGWLAPFPEDFGQMQGWGFDVDENDKELIVRADMPGFDENELDVRLENDVLTIKAEKEQKGDNEREYRSFFRQVTLPSGVDADKAQASYNNGVFELHIPRPEGSKAKRIPVQPRHGLTDKSDGNGGEKASHKAKK